MKLSIIKMLPIATIFGILQGIAYAGYSSYPPEQVKGYSFFEDSDNANNAKKCPKGIDIPCVSATYLPRGVKLATTPSGVPMLAQAIWFSSTSRFGHVVTYNLTMEPDYSSSDEAVSKFRKWLGEKYNVDVKNVDVSPTDIGSIQFIVRSQFGSGVPTRTGGEIALGTTFTETISPHWTGDFHNIGSRFSVIIRGKTWDLEPTLQKMFLKQAGNALVGQVSFSFPVKSTIFDANISCDIRLFQETVRSTIKTWNLTHTWGPGYDHETFDNDERNAIRASINVYDFCDVQQFNDATHLPLSELDKRKDQLFNDLFSAAFKKISESTEPTPQGGKDARYTYIEQITSMDAHGHIELHLKDQEVFNLSSDLDFYAGGVTEDNLDDTHKYFCNHFERFDYEKNTCVGVCNPETEIYMKDNPKGDSNGCVKIKDDPMTTDSSGFDIDFF